MAVGERQKDQGLKESLGRFEGQWPAWAWLNERLKKSGLEPTSVRQLYVNEARSSWAILVRPSSALVDHFDLAPEVIVLCSPWDTMQAKDVERTEALFREEAIRVDPGFALVLTGDERAQANLAAVLPETRRYLFVPGERFRAERDPQLFLRVLLREGLGSRRLFDVRLPAAGRQFFGRERELEGLERDVLRGHCLGVFGLRKVGKTSLLRQAAEKFRAGGKVVPVEVDLQGVHFNQRHLRGIVELIGHRLDAEVRGTRFRPPACSTGVQQRLVDTVEHVQRVCGARVLLVLDEYEVLLRGRGVPLRDGVELLEWLRGVAQGYPKGFNFVLAGRNATLLAPARIDGVDNPMYRFLRHVPLAGLTPEDCREMMKRIGRRMALNFAHEALEIIVQETGGHPALARTLGDLVDEHVPPSARNPATVDGGALRAVLPRFARDTEDDMRELVDASTDFDRRAGDHLVRLAHGAPWPRDASAMRVADALVGYGILHPGAREFRIGHLATWLRENYANLVKVAYG
jgi:hypothetical protein